MIHSKTLNELRTDQLHSVIPMLQQTARDHWSFSWSLFCNPGMVSYHQEISARYYEAARKALFELLDQQEIN